MDLNYLLSSEVVLSSDEISDCPGRVACEAAQHLLKLAEEGNLPNYDEVTTAIGIQSAEPGGLVMRPSCVDVILQSGKSAKFYCKAAVFAANMGFPLGEASKQS